MSIRLWSLRNGVNALAKKADDIVGRDLGEDVGFLEEGVGQTDEILTVVCLE